MNEAAWTSGTWLNISNVTVPTNTMSATAKYQAYWDANNLYIGVVITKSPATLFAGTAGALWSSDAIEIYFDMDHNRSTTYDSNDFHYTFGWNSPTPDISGGTSLVGVQYGYFNTGTGWSAEVAIPWSSLGVSAAQGADYGFDIAADVASASGTRNCQLTWHCTTGNNYQDTSGFGDLILGTACPVTPTWTPTPTSTPTSPCSPSLAVGAVTSFTSYEAEAGALGAGASIVAMTTPPNTQYSAPEIEASGRAYVKLNANGQYVQWTNNTGQPINGINLRSSIQDAAGGGGTSSTIDLYVNGVFRQAFNVTSTQNYCYEGLTYNDQTDKNPADGHPRYFWNDTHAFVAGAPINPGDTFRFQMDTASNNSPWYYLDVVDVENVPATLSQPANSLSITSYGAQPNNISFDNTTAINNCFAAAISQGKVVWVPPGIWYFSAINGGLGGYNVSVSKGLTIEGAGPWYSTFYRVVPAGNTQGIANIITTQNSTMENLALDTNASSRAGNNNNGACNFSGDNWKINNIWIQHVTSAFWCAGSNGIAENCRSQSIWSDGGNFNNVEDSRGIGSNLTYTNNFVRGAGDDSMAINSVNYNGSTFYTMMNNITYSHNTAIAPWGGKGIGIYGGSNIVVENNLLQDTARYLGLGVMKFGVNGSDLLSATVMYNTVLRCGGNGYSQQQQAMMIGNGGDGQGVGTVENAYIAYNSINNAIYDAVGFSSNGLNNVMQNNTINAPGLDGIAFGNKTIDLGTCTGDAVLLNNTVNNLPGGRSALLTQSGYTVYTPTMAASYNASSGVVPETCTEGGQDIGSISNGSYTEYNSVNLGSVVTFIARVASAGSGGNIEIRMDSPTGTLLGTSVVPVTGCWQGWTETQCNLSGASGTHNLYLVYTGGAGNLFNVEWFTLSTYANVTT